MTTSAALALNAVSVPFGPDPDGEGLRDLTLHVAAGERVVLLGPSGEGKTTLLRATAGLAPVTAGRIQILGRDVTDTPPEQRGAVYLHQVPVLFPHLTVAQNVAFPLTVRGTSRREAHTLVAALLERLDLGGLSDRMPHALSGGQQHRVALARALASRPHVLLLDEPLSALDPVLRRDVRDAVRQANEDSDAALLLVTHDLDDATALGDRIAIMLDRRLVQVATAETLFARPASRAVMRFLGMHTEVAGQLTDRGRVQTEIGPLCLPDDVHASVAGHSPVIVGIRHDAVRCNVGSDLGMEAMGAARTLVGTVRTVQHDAHGSTAIVEVHGDAPGATHRVVLPVRVVALDAPAVGSSVSLTIDPRGLVAFPADTDTPRATPDTHRV